MQELLMDLPGGSYPIQIAAGLFDSLPGKLARRFPGARVMLITDQTVNELYGRALGAALHAQGVQHAVHVLPGGEGSKSAQHLLAIYDALSEHALSRTDIIVALGGGVVGDIAGFAAATYLRGLRFVQMPTTLLAQVDSSVGGKTAINLPRGKNLVGAFYQPSLVCIDPQVLGTLPAPEFAAGMAEVIKTAAILDASLFTQLERVAAQGDLPAHLPSIIARCCQLKASVVRQDERDNGLRLILNFGHTVGHALERALGMQGISHGYAVAIGMVCAADIGERRGITAPGTAQRLRALLKHCALPVHMPPVDRALLLDALARDKKILDGTLRMVLLTVIGACDTVAIPVAQIEQLLAEVAQR